MSSLEIDGDRNCYDAMTKYLLELKGVSGITCEVGLRRGGGTVHIINSLIENGDKRTHVSIDPYGTIMYSDIAGVHRTDYTNQMRNQTISDIFKFAYDNEVNLIFFNMEDSEFYKRFSDGVPVYDMEKELVNEYAFVHIDGQHDLESVMIAADFFKDRVSLGGILVFDNTEQYEHDKVDYFLKQNGFTFLENVQPCYRQFYKKVSEDVQWKYYT